MNRKSDGAGKISVVVVDGHPIIQDAVAYKLAGRDDIELVATGEVGEDVMPLVAQHQPDVLIVDIHMRQSIKNDCTYFQAIPIIYEIAEKHPATRVIILTSYLVPALVQEVLQRKVRGYLLKRDKLSRKLPEAIDTVMMGGLYLSETVSQNLMGGHGAKAGAWSKLKPRQMEALKQVFNAPELSNAQHAANMGITVSTFKQHLSAAYEALAVPNITAALVRCVQLGIVGGDAF